MITKINLDNPWINVDISADQDFEIIISTANNRKATTWPQTKTTWSKFCERCNNPTITSEPLDRFMKMKKSRQDELKDVGGYVGGRLRNGNRSKLAVLGRTLVTLDFDNVKPHGTDDFLRSLQNLKCTYAVYSTRKHTPENPRFRVILPADREMTADEYEPVSRYLAERIGIDAADPTTFEVNRMMYWPSCSSDSVFVFKHEEKTKFKVDGVLSTYRNWKDVQEWPKCPGEEIKINHQIKRQQNPKEKKGLVGAFCRVYDIPEAIDKFLPGVYIPDGKGRYSYAEGSTTGGAILYEDGAFLYSHHATDPISGQLVNSFDLVRIHKFGDKDSKAKPDTPTHRLPSYKAMTDFVQQIPEVSQAFSKERLEEAREKFSGAVSDEASEDKNWRSLLDKNANGETKNTINNVKLIIENDPNLKGSVAYDAFQNRGVLLKKVPWDEEYKETRLWEDFDDAGIRHYLETFYGITSENKISDALLITARQNEVHEVKEYLDGLIWDGTERLDTLFIDYLGAPDTPYNRAVARKSFTAAVARIYSPGTKYDYMPILAGPQGIGKSTLLSYMAGRDWFNDSLQTFKGKEASELLQGVWIIEVGELSAMSYTETNTVKQFLSKNDDVYRAAYGRHTSRYPRQCVFFGTSNETEFLRDTTGNRRFWPVTVGENKPTKSIWDDLLNERDQLWAEARTRYILGEPLYLSRDLEKAARKEQKDYQESSAKEGVIGKFLERKVPENWSEWEVPRRRMFWQGGLTYGGKLVPRDRVCAAEIWTECLSGDLRFMKRADSIEINGIMNNMKGWRRNKTTLRYGPYGAQRGYERSETLKHSNESR